MREEVVECMLDALVLDERAFPDRDRSHVYEHLKYYCSKFRPLPAVTVRADREPAVVVSGHKYYRIAKEAADLSIRAIVRGDGRSDSVRRFLERPDVKVLGWDRIARETDAAPVVCGSQIYYFYDPLPESAKREFDERLAGFFRRLESALLSRDALRVWGVEFGCGDTRAEFMARVPVADERWYGACRAAALRFDAEIARIWTFQGAQFAR